MRAYRFAGNKANFLGRIPAQIIADILRNKQVYLVRAANNDGLTAEDIAERVPRVGQAAQRYVRAARRDLHGADLIAANSAVGDVTNQSHGAVARYRKRCYCRERDIKARYAVSIDHTVRRGECPEREHYSRVREAYYQKKQRADREIGGLLLPENREYDKRPERRFLERYDDERQLGQQDDKRAEAAYKRSRKASRGAYRTPHKQRGGLY